jgi:hypothetical protein
VYRPGSSPRRGAEEVEAREEFPHVSKRTDELERQARRFVVDELDAHAHIDIGGTQRPHVRNFLTCFCLFRAEAQVVMRVSMAVEHDMFRLEDVIYHLYN